MKRLNTMKLVKRLGILAVAAGVFLGGARAVYAAEVQNIVMEEVTVTETIAPMNELYVIGAWGELSWSVTKDVLTITGSGEMIDESYKKEYPWKKYASEITKVVIGNYVTGIGEEAFYKMENLQAVSIGSRVKTIKPAAFYGCTGLTAITIPASVTNISHRVFAYCDNLTTVTISEGSRLNTIGKQAFLECSELQNIYLPDGVTLIDSEAFKDCSAMKAASLGSGLKEISDKVFSNCTKLSKIGLPEGIKIIGSAAFEDCISLESINIPEGIERIEKETFSNCASLISVTLPFSVKSIGTKAFRSCDVLATVKIKGYVESIEDNAFAYCPKMKTITICGDKTVYGNNVFSNTPAALYGLKDSTTQAYAKENGLNFKEYTDVEAPIIQNVVNTASGVKITWNEVPGATGYIICRNSSAEVMGGEIARKPKQTYYVDEEVESGKTYFYKIIAMNDFKQSELSEYQSITFVKMPEMVSRVNKAAGIEISWKNKVQGATGFAIYRKSYDGNDAWKRVATIAADSEESIYTWLDSSVKNDNGTIYRYNIRALGGENMESLSACLPNGRTMVRLCSRVMNSATKASATSIKCSWTTSKAVTGYEVRFMIGDKVVKTQTIGNYKTGVKTFTGLTAGKKYKVQVRSYKKVDGVGSFYSAWSVAKYVQL